MDSAVDEESGWIYESDLGCSACGDKLGYGEEAYLLQVVRIRAETTATGLVLAFDDVLDHNEQYGLDPHFLEACCWEAEKEDIHKANEKASVVPLSLPRHAVCSCSICRGSITHGELVATAHLGEVSVSDLSPDGEDALEFVMPNQAPDIICASCLWVLNDEVTSYWEDEDQTDLIVDAVQLREQWALAATG